MQDPDNNIDDLLRKAAEHYRPALGESDWDKIAAGLSPGIPRPARSSDFKRKITYSTILVVLFLFAGSPYRVTFFSPPKNGIINKDNYLYQHAVTAKKLQGDTRDNFADSAIRNTPQQINTVPVFIAKNNEKENRLKATTVMYSSDGLLPKKIEQLNDLITSGNTQISSPVYTDSVTRPFVNESLSTTKLADSKTPDTFFSNDTVFNIAKALPTDTLEKKLEKNTGTIAPKKKVLQKGFYMGAVAGIEFDGVKRLDVDRIGYKIGIVGGYQFNQRISFETGLLYNKKNYNADGKYFNMEKVSGAMPAGMQVLSLKGNCSEYEMPVNFIYRIANSKTKNIYLSAGASSYLLSKESNLYNTILDGNQKEIAGTYQKSAGYFAATANLGIGYESKLNNGNALRIEPYLQLPLKGIGVGKLNVMSVGVHAGYLLFPKK